MLRRLSLRARLLIGVIVLAAAGLIAADLATYTALKSFLYDRVDSTLNSTHPGVEHVLFPTRGPNPGGPNPGDNLQGLFNSIPGYCIQVRGASQAIQRSFCVHGFGDNEAAPGPKLPAKIMLPGDSNSDDGDRVHYFTVGAISGGDRYRVRASIEPSAPNQILLIAAPLNSVDSTLHRLLLIELLVTAIALLAMTVVGLWVIRIGLKPLDAMGKTAAAIAAGDLTQRVEEDDRTEVGRLGLALNSMLTHIEEAVSALEASESKLRRFVADASHELRTPLAAVRAYAELFTRGAADRPDDLERSMKGISRESERMSVLVEDLLLLAHLDEGRPLTLEPVAFEDVVAEAIETARTLEPERPLAADLTPSTVLGDHDRLRQVIDNLLGNVRAHTPPDAPLEVTLSHDGDIAVLAVADSGSGMEEETRAHVFERFYRADPSRARASGGAGLGLAIVDAVVEAHGGTVEVESEPGTGTTVRVRIPLAP